jgi:uncharacterized membrane protein YozB (DUF420 family)
MDIFQLPKIDAILNAVSTVFIISGLVFIRLKMVKQHIACMAVALLASAAFLTVYLTYHFQAPTIHFTTPGLPKVIYLSILLTHIPLALVATVMVLITVFKALKGNFAGHKKIARWTFPIWLYVSITGVIIYLMLFVWFRSTELPPLPPG